VVPAKSGTMIVSHVTSILAWPTTVGSDISILNPSRESTQISVAINERLCA
jgi:hypothetical protein